MALGGIEGIGGMEFCRVTGPFAGIDFCHWSTAFFNTFEKHHAVARQVFGE